MEEKFAKLIDLIIDPKTADEISFRINQCDDLSGEWSAPIITKMDAETIRLHFPTAEISPHWSTDRLFEMIPDTIRVNDTTFLMKFDTDLSITNTGVVTRTYCINYNDGYKILVSIKDTNLRQLLIDCIVYIITSINKDILYRKLKN